MALGLLVDGKIDLAMGIVEHCIFEIKHYNKVLNGNRSYVSREIDHTDESTWHDPNPHSSLISHCRFSISSIDPTWTGTSSGSRELSKLPSRNTMRIGWSSPPWTLSLDSLVTGLPV
jgi:hypothetical protein